MIGLLHCRPIGNPNRHHLSQFERHQRSSQDNQSILKSMTLPLESVNRPSSKICNIMLKTSGCFQFHQTRLKCTDSSNRFGQLATFGVTDVTWRRTNQFGNSVSLHKFRHIQTNHRIFAAKVKLRQGLG